jgi:uncharacterized HAD superfamily protein
MKIGLDLDEVTADFLESLLVFYKEKTGSILRRENFKSYNFWESGIGKDKEEAIKISYEFHDSEHFDDIKPINGAVDTINFLMENNEIIVVTSRPKPWEEKTERWVKKYLDRLKPVIVYSGDFHNQGKTKAELCEENGVEIMFEDNAEYALSCVKRGIFVILFDQPWNQNVKHEKIIRVKDWFEAKKAVERIDKELNN